MPRADVSGPLGTWYLNVDGSSCVVTIADGAPPRSYRGTLLSEGGATEQLDQIRWDPSARSVEFRRHGQGFWEWYRGRVVEGILVGRFSRHSQSPERPVERTSYTRHITGWNSEYLDRDIVPRVYDVLIHDQYRARLRIDRAPRTPGAWVGRLKVYSTISAGAKGEELEGDLEIHRWDGVNLKFTRRAPGSTQTYVGLATGHTISGTYTVAERPGEYPWHGVRAEVLSFGLASKSSEDRVAWQRRTRRQLEHLMLAGNPQPLTRKVTTLRSHLAPLSSTQMPANRDDDPARWPQDYQLTELQFDYTLADPDGGPALVRRSHAYLAVPNRKPSAEGKFPAVLAINGHNGSAWKVMNPDDENYWYGDSFARRGFVVLAVDIAHRPVADRARLYSDYPAGDDPSHGNVSRPSIEAPGLDSDWEEDGERAWDVMRALDYLLTLPYVDRGRVLVTGLSLGGEIASIVGALDLRVSLSIPAAFPPDLDVVNDHGNHPCWRWSKADIREYLGASDFLALIAPRPLIIETGERDFTFSSFAPPFAAYKQVARRVRAAYGQETDNFVHYLHYDGHHYHIGGPHPVGARGPNPDGLLPAPDMSSKQLGVRVPVLVNPEAPWSTRWQTDNQTRTAAPTLYDLIDRYLGSR